MLCQMGVLFMGPPIHKPLFCKFNYCTAASGPYLVTEYRSIVKSLNGGAAAHTVLTDLDDQKLFSSGMTSTKSTASDIF